MLQQLTLRDGQEYASLRVEPGVNADIPVSDCAAGALPKVTEVEVARRPGEVPIAVPVSVTRGKGLLELRVGPVGGGRLPDLFRFRQEGMELVPLSSVHTSVKGVIEHWFASGGLTEDGQRVIVGDDPPWGPSSGRSNPVRDE